MRPASDEFDIIELGAVRRTFATRLDRGVPLEDVQRLGRWTSSTMLLSLYAASDRDRLRRAADVLAETMRL
jgi:hypothetical protein